MPYPPQHDFLYFCPHCRWKKHTKPNSDVYLLGLHVFSHCPNCGNGALEKDTISKSLYSAERWLTLSHWLRK